ncbi:MAG: hypothetical protein M3004_11525 [Bacteroidota bacterium]|nr:hypothetical protein [Bacteroidota bacterium]
MTSSPKNDISSEDNFLNEHQPDYEKAEMDQLRDALKRTYKERFLVATSLYKIQQMLSRATITHKPYSLDK